MAEQDLDIVIRVRGGQVASSSIQGVAKATEQVGVQTEETTKKTGKLGSQLKTLATGFAVYKGYQYIKGAVNTTADLAKSTAGLQRITGMDARTSAGWVVTAKERGIQAKQLNMGFITLARNISGAASGSKSSAKAFAQLGLDAANLKVQTPTVQLGMLADSFKALPPGVDKAALAQKLFGRQAQTLLPLINQGSQALNGQIAAAGKASGMNDQSVKSGLALAKQQREVRTAMLGVQVAVGTALVPILASLAQVIAPIATAFASLMQSSQGFRVAVVALTAALITYIAVTKLADLTSKSFLLTVAPWAALIIGIGVAFVILYQKCAWFRNAVQAAMHAVVAAVMWVKNAAVAVFNWISANWKLLASILTWPFLGPLVLILTHLKQFKAVVSSVASAIKNAFTSAFNAVTSVAKGAINIIISGWNRLQFKIPGFKVGPVHFGGTSIGVPQIAPLAEGGLLTAPRLALVGERGPEIVALPGGAAVYPTGTGPAGPQVIHTHVWIGEREVAHAVGNYTADRQAAR